MRGIVDVVLRAAASDDVEAIAKICQTYNVAHVINNAYGLQSRKLCGKIEGAMQRGRVGTWCKVEIKISSCPLEEQSYVLQKETGT